MKTRTDMRQTTFLAARTDMAVELSTLIVLSYVMAGGAVFMRLLVSWLAFDRSLSEFISLLLAIPFWPIPFFIQMFMPGW